ncbi:HAD-like domain-containing protein [Blakeslea trispora]|nr:HAD-like domain-containing protein [Blakeslea trispora]
MASLKRAFMSPLVLIDFDQTITTRDTIALLGQFGLSKGFCSKPWSYFVDKYLEDYQKIKQPEATSDLKTYLTQLDAYRAVEEASLARVSQHKVFRGLTRQELFDQGKQLSQSYLQPNVIDALKPIKQNVRIVSLNWSSDWIQGFLYTLGIEKEHIYSNDLVFDHQQLCTGEIMSNILTAKDKQQIVEMLDRKVIFVGDSLGDIEALVKAEIGIIIGRNKSLLSCLESLGYRVEEDLCTKKTLYRVDNWHQISQLIDKYVCS